MCARCYLWVTGSCGFSSNRKSSCVVGASICFLSVFLLLCTVNAVCHTHSGKRKHSQHTGELKYSSEHTRLCLCLRFTRWSCSPPPARTYPRASIHQAAITVNRLISHSHKAEFSSPVVVCVFCKMWKLPWQKITWVGEKRSFDTHNILILLHIQQTWSLVIKQEMSEQFSEALVLKLHKLIFVVTSSKYSTAT